MKFATKDKEGSISIRGESYVAKDGIAELPEDLTAQEMELLKSVGIEPAPPTAEEEADARKFQEQHAKEEAARAAERDEKESLLREARETFGVTLDGRKSLTAIRSLVENLRKEKADEEAKKNSEPPTTEG